MRLENRERMQPRHLMSAAVIAGIIPRRMANFESLTPGQQAQLKQLLEKRKAEALSKKEAGVVRKSTAFGVKK